MSRTYTHLLTHIVFSTKNREPLIDAKLKPELHAYLGGLAKLLALWAINIGARFAGLRKRTIINQQQNIAITS